LYPKSGWKKTGMQSARIELKINRQVAESPGGCRQKHLFFKQFHHFLRRVAFAHTQTPSCVDIHLQQRRTSPFTWILSLESARYLSLSLTMDGNKSDTELQHHCCPKDVLQQAELSSSAFQKDAIGCSSIFLFHPSLFKSPMWFSLLPWSDHTLQKLPTQVVSLPSSQASIELHPR
jgi:hypothetical protein